MSWRDDAACSGHIDDWLFFEHRPSDEPIALAEARAICGPCPVQAACLERAMSDLTLEGIWAATSLNQRRRIVRNRTRTSRAKETTA